MDKVIVFGSSGILGRIIVNQICNHFGEQSLIISDYSVERAEKLSHLLKLSNKPRIIDVYDIASIESNLNDVTAAIVATNQRDPLIQEECIKRGIVTVDVTAFKTFVEKVKKLDQLAKQNSVPTLVMAGYFPGLSGVAVNELVNYYDIPEEISVSLLQSTNTSTGKSGFIDMINIINSEIVTNKGKIKGFTVTKEFYHDDYQKIFKQYQIKSDEAEILSGLYGIDIQYFR
jgi:saccharopine dehydrogenase-like NADP-dependent oxidoreductase